MTGIFRLTPEMSYVTDMTKGDWRKDLRSMPLWRGGLNTRTLPTVLLTPPASKAADMAHLCVPQNQALGVCRRLFLTSKYAALTGEWIQSTQPSHRKQRRTITGPGKTGPISVTPFLSAAVTSFERRDGCHIIWSPRRVSHHLATETDVTSFGRRDGCHIIWTPRRMSHHLDAETDVTSFERRDGCHIIWTPRL